MKKKYIFIFLSITFSILIAFSMMEVFFVLNKNKHPWYFFGWANSNITSEKISKCNKTSKPKIGVFGDSFVEFYGNSNINLVKSLQKKFPTYTLCNFGLQGTDINTYISRFRFALDSNFEMKYAIFYFYEGNDFIDHFYPENNKKYNDKK